jgi:hypothetical protein
MVVVSVLLGNRPSLLLSSFFFFLAGLKRKGALNRCSSRQVMLMATRPTSQISSACTVAHNQSCYWPACLSPG